MYAVARSLKIIVGVDSALEETGRMSEDQDNNWRIFFKLTS